MNLTPGLFNWSLKRLLETEQNVFNVAKIKILYFLLVFAAIKSLITVVTAWQYEQQFQLIRGVVFLLTYIIMLKIILADKKYLNALTHMMTQAGLVIIYSILFISAHHINIVALQFVFMVFMCSIYLLSTRWAVIYSALALFPVVVFLLIHPGAAIAIENLADELAWPGQFLIILLNFITFIVSQYLFHEAFTAIIASKESLNNQLETALGESERLAQSKSDFLSTMSHELRTPLNIVIGMSEVLRENPHNPEQKENIDQINFAAVHLHALINDILDFNKIESGKLELEELPVKLSKQVQSVCAGMEVRAKEKGLKFYIEIDPRLKEVYVLTDPIRLSQILYNLIGNGIKFTPNGSVSINLKAVAQTERTLTVHFSVRDTGIGISQEKQASIFDPFVQESSSTTRSYGGTGLGLSIVCKLLELFKSRIILESSQGMGSNFHFEILFPLTVDPEVKDEQDTTPKVNLSSIRLLIAEDNSMNVFLLRRILNNWNIHPDVVQNGREAVDKIKAGDYNFLLLDIHMPEMDGYEAARQIRLLKNGGPKMLTIIALTASVAGDLEFKVLESGMDGFVRKPFSSKELYRKLILS